LENQHRQFNHRPEVGVYGDEAGSSLLLKIEPALAGFVSIDPDFESGANSNPTCFGRLGLLDPDLGSGATFLCIICALTCRKFVQAGFCVWRYQPIPSPQTQAVDAKIYAAL